MRKSRYTDEQIIGFIRQAEAGMSVADLCRRAGFSTATFYKWRAKFGGMQVSDAKKLGELEAENGKLKKLLVAQNIESWCSEALLLQRNDEKRHEEHVQPAVEKPK